MTVAVWHCPYLITALAAVLLLSDVQRLLCGSASILCRALAVWFCFYLMYSGCCVVLLPILRIALLCGYASIFCTAVAVWHCPLPLSCLLRLLCGFASVLCTAVAVWHFPDPVDSACCVVSFLSYVQRLLCGTGACCVAWSLPCLQLPFCVGLRCGLPPILLGSYAVYSAYCAAWVLCCLQRLLCDSC